MQLELIKQVILFYHFKLAFSAVNNVLFVVVDDLRADIGSYDGAAITPNIDKLAETGFLFNRAYAQMALCAPSRNSFLTSKRPDSLGLYDVHSYWRDSAGNFSTIPQYLRSHGYHTHSIGKIFHPGKSSNFSDDYPYSWSDLPWHPPSEKFKDEPVCKSRGRWQRNLLCPVSLPEQPGGTLPDIESTHAAVTYLASRKEQTQPFFLALGYQKPHIPFKFPRKYIDLYPLKKIQLPAVRRLPDGLPTVAWNPWNDVRRRDDIAALNVSYPYGPLSDEWIKKIRQSYYASVSYVDDLFGSVMKSLQDNGLENNTVVLILGDHGWSLGEHGEWAKYSNYENALRTPLIIRCPKLTHGNKIDAPVELLDLFPTLVDILGLPNLRTCRKRRSADVDCVEGRSLLPLMLGRSSHESLAFSQYPRPGVTSSRQPNSDQPNLDEITVMGYSVRTNRHRYTLWVAWKAMIPDWSDVKGEELYDHKLDPSENVNLAMQPGVEKLRSHLRSIIIKKFTDNPRSLCLDCEETEAKKRVARLGPSVNLTAVVDLNHVLHETDSNFLSFALDTAFIRKDLRNLNESQWQKFTELSKALSPALLRLGGTDADRLIFTDNVTDGVVNLSEDDWAIFNVFVEKSNLTLMFDFNVLLRENAEWDSSNAEEILRFSRASGFQISNFQLGNEPNSFQHVFNVSIPANQLAKDFGKLRDILNSDDFYKTSLLIGPDVTNPRLSFNADDAAEGLGSLNTLNRSSSTDDTDPTSNTETLTSTTSTTIRKSTGVSTSTLTSSSPATTPRSAEVSTTASVTTTVSSSTISASSAKSSISSTTTSDRSIKRSTTLPSSSAASSTTSARSSSSSTTTRAQSSSLPSSSTPTTARSTTISARSSSSSTTISTPSSSLPSSSTPTTARSTTISAKSSSSSTTISAPSSSLPSSSTPTHTSSTTIISTKGSSSSSTRTSASSPSLTSSSTHTTERSATISASISAKSPSSTTSAPSIERSSLINSTTTPSTSSTSDMKSSTLTSSDIRRKRDLPNGNLTLDPVEYLREFLQSNIKALSAVSWHHYYLNGKSATVRDFTSAQVLDSFGKNIQVIVDTVREFSGEIPIWLTETGSAYGGGAANLSDRYVSTILLLDKLGLAAKNGIALVARQSLYGGHYSLFTTDFEPNPDFWISLYYKILVGSRVYPATNVGNEASVRLYAHNVRVTSCLKNPSVTASIVVYGVNLGEKYFDMNIVGTTELVYCAGYVFTAPDGDLQSRDILLNDRLLVWESIPNSVDNFVTDFASLNDTISLPPFGVAFWVFSSPQF